MRIALVNPKSLELEVVEVGPRAVVAIPLGVVHLSDHDSTGLERIVTETFQAEAVQRHYEALRKRNVALRRRGLTERHAFSLDAPPPWVLALATLMWEGIIQGASYAVVSKAVRSALGKLRAAGAAPSVESRPSRTTFEFGWRQVADRGKRQRELWVRLTRLHERARELGLEESGVIAREPGLADLNKPKETERGSVVFPIERKRRPTKQRGAKRTPKRKPRRSGRRG